jgi:alpha-beta hydrolase superfamily lysophospholipase
VLRLATDKSQAPEPGRAQPSGASAAGPGPVAIKEAAVLPRHGSREPLYFPGAAQSLFGWLHWPAGEPFVDVGVVICKPFGYESICANRSMREFADAIASLGMPALRLDYAGTGDAEDPPAGGEELSGWTQDILAGIQELRRRTGVRRICLLGIRLGALLATLAAEQSQAVDYLVLIAPVTNGRRYLRELRRVQLAAPGLSVVAPNGSGDTESIGTTVAFERGAFEVSGFALSAATIESMRGIDLTQLRAAPARRILVIDREDLPAAQAWAQGLVRLGATVDYQVLPGIVAMVWTAPHYSAPPRQLIAATRSWLEQLEGFGEGPGAVSSPQASVARASVARASAAQALRTLPFRTRASGASVLRLSDGASPPRVLTERPLFFAAGPMRFGILTEPPAREARRRGVIFVNDGATYHVGANRLNVALARRWAAQGYTVLRMDLAGLGESDARPGQRPDDAFPEGALEDIGAAVRYLRSACGSSQVTLVGLCSGAYHCLRAAVAGLAVDKVLLVNPQNYFWKRGMTVEDVQLIEIVSAPSKYRQRMLSLRNWGKLLRGEADVRRIAWVQLSHAWLRLQVQARDVARRLHLRLPRDLGRELEQLVTRGVQVVFVFASGEVGLQLLHMQGGRSLARLGRGCRVHVIDGADHIFSQSAPRHLLEELLSRELLATSADARAAPASLACAKA